MPINISESVNNIAGKIGGNKIISKTFSNPFYTALLISIVIFLIILFVFRNVEIDDDSESLTKLAFRGSVYALILLTGIQFMQNYYMLNETKTGGKDEVINQAFSENTVTSKRIETIGKNDSSGKLGTNNPEIVDFNLSFL